MRKPGQRRRSALRWVGVVAGLCVAGLVLSTVTASADIRTTYCAVSLAPDAESSVASAVNTAGTVVGWSASGGVLQATAWGHGATVSLGLPPGDASSQAYAVNDRGQIVGNASRPAQSGEPGERVQHGFAWSPEAGPSDIPDGSADVQTSAASVNNAGTVVGSLTVPGAGFQAFQRPAGGVIETLPLLPGLPNSAALAVNQAGDIAGYAYDFTGASRAVVWRAGIPVDIGSLVAPGLNSQATDVSDSGDVVGTAQQPDGSYHGFLWSPEAVLDLGPAQPNDSLKVNDHRQVVFSSSDQLLWDDGARVDVAALGPTAQGWQLFGGTDINDAGQIVGTGSYAGKNQAFLLQPQTS